jgi:valyl-tRNA synthetase
LIDIDRETARLHKALADTGNELARSQARLANPSFVDRAPAEVVAKEQERVTVLADSVARLQQRLQLLGQDLPGAED